MAKQNLTVAKTVPGAKTGSRARFGISSAATRESIESLVVAFILAFLFRTFDAEAFVIPTGSMAPTLMGQHKDVLCSECGYRYQAGASSESDDLAAQRGRPPQTRDIIAVTCPLCRFTEKVDPQSPKGRDFPTYGGDRILVGKSVYAMSSPERWDVIVFHYPAEAGTNYIKRLVGLPEETLRLWHGDVHVKHNGEEAFHFERRTPAKTRSMSQVVYDNDFVVDAMTAKGWPVRWQPWTAPSQAEKSTWTTDDGSRSYAIEGDGDAEQWLRYQHFVPSIDEWEMLKDGPVRTGFEPHPRLITDFYAYDASVPRGEPVRPWQLLGTHWVGDLLLECELEVTRAEGTAVLDLVQGGQHFRAEFNLASGQVTLRIPGQPDYQPTAETSVRSKGTHYVALANVDHQLLVWVDGASLTFDRATSYEEMGTDVPRSTVEDPGDLAPAGIASRGAGLRVRHMKLSRDIYYISARGEATWDYETFQTRIPQMSYQELLAFWSTPTLWEPSNQLSPFATRREVTFPLAADQFFMLGDNSPMSQDTRLWNAERYVERDLIVGKALVIFWPHSFHTLPGTKVPFPFFPNFARMGFIR